MNFPKRSYPVKIIPGKQKKTIEEDTKNPRTMSRDMQTSFTLAKINVHNATFRKTPGKKWNSWKSNKTEAFDPLRKHGTHLKSTKEYLDDPPDFWRNILLTRRIKSGIKSAWYCYIWQKSIKLSLSLLQTPISKMKPWQIVTFILLK